MNPEYVTCRVLCHIKFKLKAAIILQKHILFVILHRYIEVVSITVA
jgi:hypothetical protein